MKIGYSTSVIQRGKTGVAQYVFALLRAMLAHADENEFNLFVLEDDLPLFDFARGKMKLIPVAEKFRPAVKNVLWHQAELPQLVKKLGLDLLHVPSYRRMLWRAPCPLVATIHDLAPFHIAGKYDWKRMIYGRVIVRWLARRQDEIIAVSENTARDLEAFFGLGRDRVKVVWNGIDHRRFQLGDVAAAKKSAVEKWQLARPFFLFVSRLEHPGKNHVRLIAAFNQFKAATKSSWLLALGGSDWHGAEAIHAAAAASPFKADIRFLGFVSDAELPGLYHATDVFIYPSLFEGFGFPPIEAMACGVPVISATRGSLREVVAGAALTIDPENPAEIAGALEKMSSSADERQRWRAAGFVNARRFDWNENAAQTLAIYERAIHGGK